MKYKYRIIQTQENPSLYTVAIKIAGFMGIFDTWSMISFELDSIEKCEWIIKESIKRRNCVNKIIKTIED